jgi:hypothetical protein
VEVVLAPEVPARRQRENPESAVALRGGGTIMQHVLSDTAADGLSFGLNRIQFLPGDQAFRSSRHHHSFQQIRWAEQGSINYGPDQFIPQGDIAYFPRGAYYGPQLKDTGIGMTVQFGVGGEKQSGEEWQKYNTEARQRLTARGQFEGDTFVEVNPETGQETRRDAVDAMFEERFFLHSGQAWSVPAEGYDAPILMHPSAFEYYELRPGAERKELGRFFDHAGPEADVRLSMLRLSGGRVYELTPDRAQVGWSVSAGLLVDGTEYPALACVYSRRGVADTISADRPTELHLVEFPRF